jgi:hypothetical protein
MPLYATRHMALSHFGTSLDTFGTLICFDLFAGNIALARKIILDAPKMKVYFPNYETANPNHVVGRIIFHGFIGAIGF